MQAKKIKWVQFAITALEFDAEFANFVQEKNKQFWEQFSSLENWKTRITKKQQL